MNTFIKITVIVAAMAAACNVEARSIPLQALGVACLAGPGVRSHVDYRPNAGAIGTTACCGGQMRCSQYLATTVVVRPPVDHRT